MERSLEAQLTSIGLMGVSPHLINTESYPPTEIDTESCPPTEIDIDSDAGTGEGERQGRGIQEVDSGPQLWSVPSEGEEEKAAAGVDATMMKVNVAEKANDKPAEKAAAKRKAAEVEVAKPAAMPAPRGSPGRRPRDPS